MIITRYTGGGLRFRGLTRGRFAARGKDLDFPAISSAAQVPYLCQKRVRVAFTPYLCGPSRGDELVDLALLRVDVSYMGESRNTSVARSIDLGFRASLRGGLVEVRLEVGLVILSIARGRKGAVRTMPMDTLILRVIVDGANLRVVVDIH